MKKFKKFVESLKVTLANVGNSTEKILKDLEKSDKEMNNKIRKATGGIE